MQETLRLLAEAASLNSRIISLPRIQLLAILAEHHPEAVEFRELQSALAMSDGKLISNLYALRDMGYIAAIEVKVENKTLTAYGITPAGVEDWERAKGWLREWLAST